MTNMKSSPRTVLVSQNLADPRAASPYQFTQEVFIGGETEMPDLAADAAHAPADSEGVKSCKPLILVESKIAVPSRRIARISGFQVPKLEPCKVSSDKSGTLAEILKRGSRFEPCAVSPGVIVTNPPLQPGGPGTGYLTVVWTASQAGLAGQANWWINAASPHPIPTTKFPLGVGNATVTFGPLAGYTAPAPVLIHIWVGQTTTLTVTYGQP